MSFAAACSTRCGAFSGCTRPANMRTTASARRPSLRRAASFDPGWNTARSTPGLTVLTLDVSAPYRPTSWSASAAVLATSRSAAAITSASPRIRICGSAQSPVARAAFFTLPSVCMDWTSGTPQRSLATAPTWPDSQ